MHPYLKKKCLIDVAAACPQESKHSLRSVSLFISIEPVCLTNDCYCRFVGLVIDHRLSPRPQPPTHIHEKRSYSLEIAGGQGSSPL